ncbi:MAG: sulfotransferase [Pseudomonadota bacterium]
MSPRPPFPVIVGVPRSGTTLLRLMLDAHPDLAIPPETGFLISPHILQSTARPVEIAGKLTAFPPEAPAWRDFGISSAYFLQAVETLSPDACLADVLRLFYQTYSGRFGKSRGGDKTPSYLLHMPAIASVLPEAHFIHILRDGRDVALSWRETWFAPSRDIPYLVKQWGEMIRTARSQTAGLFYLEVRYEDLVSSPAEVLSDICSFIGLDFHSDMLLYHQRSAERLKEHLGRYTTDGDLIVSREERLQQQRQTMKPPDIQRIGSWRHILSTEDCKECQIYAGDLLSD